MVVEIEQGMMEKTIRVEEVVVVKVEEQTAVREL